MKPRSKCFIHSRSLSQTKCLYFCINFHSNDFLVSLKSLLSVDGAFPCWHLASQNKGIAHPLIQTLTPKTSKKPRPWRPRCQTSGLRAVLQKPMGDITLGLHLGSKPSAQCSPGTPCFKPRLPSESCRVGAELWRQPREQDDPSRLMCSGASVGDLTRMKAYFTAFRESQNSFFSPTFFTTLRYLLCYSFTWLQINLLDIRDSSGKPFQWLAFMNPHQSRKPFPLILQRHCLWFHYEQQGWRLFLVFFRGIQHTMHSELSRFFQENLNVTHRSRPTKSFMKRLSATGIRCTRKHPECGKMEKLSIWRERRLRGM